jgi:hypothetical protein
MDLGHPQKIQALWIAILNWLSTKSQGHPFFEIKENSLKLIGLLWHILMQVMRSTEDLGWGFRGRLNLMSIYVEFHTYMIHCFNLLENFGTYTTLNLGGLCNAQNWTKYYLNEQVANYCHVDDQCQAVVFLYWLFWRSLYNPYASLQFKLSFTLFIHCTSFQIVIFAGHNVVEGEDSLSFSQTLLSLPLNKFGSPDLNFPKL